ncbi:MAG: hypothetical protein LQ344_003453 [Seirophora lacunosa]|nr:MAG: hypothetical protein LQ344_003453 [Seirophora lacunosa]
MPSNKVVIHVVVLPILIALAIIAAVSLTQIRYLSLPISNATPIAAILLPLLTGIGIRGVQSLLPASSSSSSLSKRRASPPWLLPTLVVVLVIYDTVIATVGVTQMLPSSVLTCQLSEGWQTLWTTHDGNAIRRIQDAHQCCGFRTTANMAWPFDGDQHAGTCRTMYGRERSCLAPWRRDQQIQAGLLLLVAVGTFGVKLVVLALYRGRSPWTQQARRDYAALTNGEDEAGANTRNHEQDRSRGRIEAPYRDDIASEAGTEDLETGRGGQDEAQGGTQRRESNLILQPASVGRPENEWRT